MPNDCKTVCTVGICKNAGKTTVLNKLLEVEDRVVAVTSIGRDGEKQDLVTNTPKPEIFLKEGSLCATAEKLLPLCTVTKRILATTDFMTPLGRVIIFEATCGGYVQLAGPSIVEDMSKCRQLLFSLGAKRVYIDGAVSRLSQSRICSEQDGVILCCGASYSERAQDTIEQTAFAVELLTLPSAPQDVADLTFNGEVARVCENNILTYCTLEEAINAKTKEARFVLLNGAFGKKEGKICLANANKVKGKTILLDYGYDVQIEHKTYRLLISCGMRFCVRHSTRLLAVAYNPYSAYGNSYEHTAFIEELSSRCGYAVRDFLAKVEE